MKIEERNLWRVITLEKVCVRFSIMFSIMLKLNFPTMSAKDNNNIIITVQMVLIKDKYL